MIFSRLITLLIAVTVMLSSATVGYGRTATAMGQTLVICSDAGALEVTLDRNGNPVKSPHHCDDCCLGADISATVATAGLTAPIAVAELLERTAPASFSAETPPAKGRDPPLV